MTLDQHIAELRAELAHCILTKSERARIRAELEGALREKGQELAAEGFWLNSNTPERAAA